MISSKLQEPTYNNDDKIYIMKKENKRQKSTAPGILRRSPIQVLAGLDVA